MDNQRFESTVLNAVVRKANDKDVDDLIDEVNNFTTMFKDFKAELLEDMCQVMGLYMDRYSMDQYEMKQKQQSQWANIGN